MSIAGAVEAHASCSSKLPADFRRSPARALLPRVPSTALLLDGRRRPDWGGSLRVAVSLRIPTPLTWLPIRPPRSSRVEGVRQYTTDHFGMRHEAQSDGVRLLFVGPVFQARVQDLLKGFPLCLKGFPLLRHFLQPPDQVIPDQIPSLSKVLVIASLFPAVHHGPCVKLKRLHCLSMILTPVSHHPCSSHQPEHLTIGQIILQPLEQGQMFLQPLERCVRLALGNLLPMLDQPFILHGFSRRGARYYSNRLEPVTVQSMTWTEVQLAC